MELGSCFRNYEDFRACFRAYEEEHRLRYGLKSGVSVRFHNRRNGTRIREDVAFVQVRFGCVRSRESSKQRKQQPNLCPAYFVLQYNEGLDRLVITERNGQHVHPEPKAASAGPGPPPAARPQDPVAASAVCASPPAKLRKERSGRGEAFDAGKNVGVKVELESGVAVKAELDSEEALPLPPPPPPPREAQNSLTERDACSSALVQVAEVMKNVLRADVGSLASLSVGREQDLERLNFQTSKMKSLLTKFPESLLLHRVQGERGHVLYAFLVESKDRVGKLVHLAVLSEDTQENTRKMLLAFKEFNPEWQKVKVLFVDMSFLHRGVLQDLFPSAQVLLSVYHTVRLLEKKLKASHAASSFKHNFKLALREAVFSTSSANLSTLSPLVKHLVDRDLFEYLQTNWFSCEMLWYMHAKKGLHSCSTYIDSLDLVTQKLSGLFSARRSLETSLLRFMEYADCFNTRGPENLSRGLASREDNCRSGLIEEPRAQARAPVRRTPGLAPQPPPGRSAPEPPRPLARHSPAKPVATMLAALRETCTALACRLCRNEWEAVQRSVQLLGASGGRTAVQLLEETHQVSSDGTGCSCYFYCRFRLPCRHVLCMLLAKRQAVGEAMVGQRWQKRRQHLPLPGQDFPEGPGCPTGARGALAAPAAEERRDKVRSLSQELGNLLLQSDGEELEERTATLQLIVRIWTRCCELEGGEEPVAGKPPAVRNVGDLPFLWARKEEMGDAEAAPATPDPAGEGGCGPLG